MVAIEINCIPYLTLLECEKKLQQQGKSFFQENKEQYREMLQYEIILEDHIFFCQRQNYLNSLEYFLKKQCDSKTFIWMFITIWKKDRDQVDILKQTIFQEQQSTFATDSKAKEFSDLVDEIFGSCEVFTDSEPYYTETEFFQAMKDIWIDMRTLLEQD